MENSNPIYDEVATDARRFLAGVGDKTYSTAELQSHILKRELTAREIKDSFKALSWHATHALMDCATRGEPVERLFFGKVQVARPWRWHAPKPIEHCPTCGQVLPTV